MNYWYTSAVYIAQCSPGAIGTALFVQIGSALTKGGPGSLFLAFTYYCTIVMAVNNCLCTSTIPWPPSRFNHPVTLASNHSKRQLKWWPGSLYPPPLWESYSGINHVLNRLFRLDTQIDSSTLPLVLLLASISSYTKRFWSRSRWQPSIWCYTSGRTRFL